MCRGLKLFIFLASSAAGSAFADGNLLFREGEAWIGSFDRSKRPLTFQTCDDEKILLKAGDKIVVGDSIVCPPDEMTEYTFIFDAEVGSFAVDDRAKSGEEKPDCPTPVVGPGPLNPNQLDEIARLAKAAGLDLSKDFSMPLTAASRLFGAGLIGATEINGVPYVRKPFEDGSTTWDRVVFPDGGGCNSKKEDSAVPGTYDWGLTPDNIDLFSEIARAKRDLGVGVVPNNSWEQYQKSFKGYTPEDFSIIPMLNGMDGFSLDDY